MSGAPRLVRTIVCTYTREELPASWLQVFRRFERMIARSGLRVRVRLMPLEDLPASFEVLVVAPALAARAEALGTGARVVSTTRETAAAAADEIVRELRAGTSLTAEPARPGEPKIVAYRGSDEE